MEQIRSMVSSIVLKDEKKLKPICFHYRTTIPTTEIFNGQIDGEFLTTLPQNTSGTFSNMRIADSVIPLWVDWNVEVYPTTLSPTVGYVGGLVRCSVLFITDTLDQSSDIGGVPPLAEIYATASVGPMTPFNPLNETKASGTKKYRVIFDETKVLGRVESVATGSYAQGANVVQFKGRTKLTLPVGYVTGSNTGGIADCKTNHLVMFCSADASFSSSASKATVYKEILFAFQN